MKNENETLSIVQELYLCAPPDEEERLNPIAFLETLMRMLLLLLLAVRLSEKEKNKKRRYSSCCCCCNILTAYLFSLPGAQFKRKKKKSEGHAPRHLPHQKVTREQPVPFFPLLLLLPLMQHDMLLVGMRVALFYSLFFSSVWWCFFGEVFLRLILGED